MRPSARAHPKEAKSLPQGLVTICHGRHSFVEMEDGVLLEAYRRGRRGDVVVGDIVRCRVEQGGTASVEEVLPRKSLLYRSDEFRTKELAANVDLVAVVFASRPAYNPWFIWKALLAASKAGIEPVVIRNKTDFAEGAEAAAAEISLLKELGVATLSISAVGDPPAARNALEEVFRNRRTLLVGQSGMGKSTILNLLVKEARAATQEFSEALGTGKQTTTTSHWYKFGDDGAIVDTPGFQEFGLRHLTLEDIVAGMPDVARHAHLCRFLDCRHLEEPDCAVKAALAEGSLSQRRYDFYRAMALEATKPRF